MEWSDDQIEEQVISALARCLARNAEEIKVSDTLINHLGLDSLDFLDLMFALEKAFKVKIRDDDFDRLLKPTQAEALSPNLTADEMESMSRFIPGLIEKMPNGLIPRNSVISMMTVGSLVNMVIYKLNK